MFQSLVDSLLCDTTQKSSVYQHSPVPEICGLKFRVLTGAPSFSSSCTPGSDRHSVVLADSRTTKTLWYRCHFAGSGASAAAVAVADIDSSLAPAAEHGSHSLPTTVPLSTGPEFFAINIGTGTGTSATHRQTPWLRGGPKPHLPDVWLIAPGKPLVILNIGARVRKKDVLSL